MHRLGKRPGPQEDIRAKDLGVVAPDAHVERKLGKRDLSPADLSHDAIQLVRLDRGVVVCEQVNLVPHHDAREQNRRNAHEVVQHKHHDLGRRRASKVPVGIPPVDDAQAQHREQVRPCHAQPRNKAHKVRVVSVPDAVSDPRAVVVHPQHAPLALLAVVRPRRLERVALVAKPAVLGRELDSVLRHRLVGRPAGRHTAGVARHRLVVSDVHVGHEHVEYPKHAHQLFKRKRARRAVVGQHDKELRREMQKDHDQHNTRHPA